MDAAQKETVREKDCPTCSGIHTLSSIFGDVTCVYLFLELSRVVHGTLFTAPSYLADEPTRTHA